MKLADRIRNDDFFLGQKIIKHNNNNEKKVENGAQQGLMADTTDEGVRAQIEADKNESLIFPDTSLKIR